MIDLTNKTSQGESFNVNYDNGISIDVWGINGKINLSKHDLERMTKYLNDKYDDYFDDIPFPKRAA